MTENEVFRLLLLKEEKIKSVSVQPLMNAGAKSMMRLWVILVGVMKKPGW